MQKHRDNLIANGLKHFSVYSDSSLIFPGTTISGGISVTYFEKDYNGDILYDIINENNSRVYDINKKIFLNHFEEEIYLKLFTNIDVNQNMKKYVYGNIGVIGNCFGYDKQTQMKKLQSTPDGLQTPIKIYAGTQLGYQPKYCWQYIDRAELSKLQDKLLSSRKLMIGTAGRQMWANKSSEICGTPSIIDANAIADSSLFIFPAHDTDRELKLIKSLFMTKTARYAMTLTMKTLYVDGFENIPDYLELAKLLPEDQLFTDQWFYETFNFSQELINEIETRVSPKIEK